MNFEKYEYFSIYTYGSFKVIINKLRSITPFDESIFKIFKMLNHFWCFRTYLLHTPPEVFQRQPPKVYKKDILKISQISHRKIPVLESLFIKKRDSDTGVFLWILRNI